MTVRKTSFRLLERSDNAIPPAGVVQAALYAVENVAALSALDDSAYADGTGVSMRSVLDVWLLNRDSVLVPDGISIVAANSGVGNWVRQNTHSTEWLQRSTWHIDQAAGDDENDGATAPTALASWEELVRRCGNQILPGATVTLDSDYTGTIYTEAEARLSQGAFLYELNIEGSRTVLYSGEITAFQRFSEAGITYGRLEDTTIPVSWTASGLVGHMIVLTSGNAAGAVAHVVADLGAKTCSRGPFFDVANQTVVEADLQVGDTFDVVSLTRVIGSYLNNGSGTVGLVDIRFSALDYFDAVVGNGIAVFKTCQFMGIQAPLVANSQGSFLGCYVNHTGDAYGQLDAGYGSISVFMGTVLQNVQLATHNGTISVSVSSAMFGTADTNGNAVLVDDSGFMRIESGVWLSIFDWTSAGAVVAVQENSRMANDGPIFGDNNTCAWFYQVLGGCAIISSAMTDVNTLGGAAATEDTAIGSTVKAYADLPYVDVSTLAGITTSS